MRIEQQIGAVCEHLCMRTEQSTSPTLKIPVPNSRGGREDTGMGEGGGITMSVHNIIQARRERGSGVPHSSNS